MATNSDKKNKHADAAMRAKRQSFKKRKDCILKKSMELSVLCGIKVCAVIVDPDGKVETWPENRDDVMEIVKLYYQNFSDDGSKVDPKKKKVDLDHNLDHHDHDRHQVVLDVQQRELDEAKSWIEGLSETPVNEFLTEINAKMNAVGSKIDILKRTSTTMVDNDDDGGQINDHTTMAGALVVSCDDEKAMEDYSTFLDTKMIDDQTDDIIMPAAIVVCEGEEVMEHSIFKDQNQSQIHHTFHYVDDQQNFDYWFDKQFTWNRFEEDASMLHSDFWQ